MDRQKGSQINLGTLLQSVAAAGFFFGTTGVAFAQQPDYAAISACIKSNGFKRTDVMNFSAALRPCIERAKGVQPGTWSSLNSGYLSQIKDQDQVENQQKKLSGGMGLQNCQSNAQSYDYMLADIAQKAKFYQCQLPPSSDPTKTAHSTPAPQPKPAPQPTQPTQPTQTTQTTPTTQGASAAGNASKCIDDGYKGRKGWQCSAVVGGWDNGQNSFGVSSGICARADAETLAKANNVENCNNLIFNIEKRMQDAAKGVVSPVVSDADAAVTNLKGKFASAADPAGANKAFWTTWTRIYNNCKGVPAGTPPSADRLKNYCGFNASGQPDASVGLKGLTAVVNGCTSASCTLNASAIKFPTN